eukprot:g16022.t1
MCNHKFEIGYDGFDTFELGGDRYSCPSASAYQRSSSKSETSRNSSCACHQCHLSFGPGQESQVIHCTRPRGPNGVRACRKKFCLRCLDRYSEVNMDDKDKFVCPACLGVCSCAGCDRTRRGERGMVSNNTHPSFALSVSEPGLDAPSGDLNFNNLVEIVPPPKNGDELTLDISDLDHSFQGRFSPGKVSPRADSTTPNRSPKGLRERLTAQGGRSEVKATVSKQNVSSLWTLSASCLCM